MRFSKKGQTDYISLFFLLTILISTFIVIFLTVPGLGEFFTEFLTSILTSIIVIAIGSFLILFGVIIAGRHPPTGRTIAYIGVGVLLIGLLIIQTAYVTKSREALKMPMTERCSRFYGSGINPADFVTCIITGYRYKGDYAHWAFIGFWVFGVVVPILLFISLFEDLVISSGVMRQRRLQRIVGICLGLIAYRGFAVTNLLETLSLGALGIGLLALNLIFLGGLLAYIHRVFERWRPIEAAMGIARSSIAARRILRENLSHLERTLREGDIHGAQDILETMYHSASLVNPVWASTIRNISTHVAQGDFQQALNEVQNLRNLINRTV